MSADPIPDQSDQPPQVGLLLVDDRQENLLALTALLDQPDYRCVTARSGRQALSILLDDQDFAVVLLDVQMPEMSGFEVARLMRQHERTRRIPIIFVTAAYQDLHDVHRGYGLEAIDYLLKPVDEVVLKSKVGILADLYRTTKALTTENRIRRQLEAALRASGGEAAPELGLGTGPRADAEGCADLQAAQPQRFAAIAQTYADLLLHALESRTFRDVPPKSEALQALADELGALGAAAMDVVEVHLAALKSVSEGVNARRQQFLEAEGRYQALQVMGFLANYYRRNCLREAGDRVD